MAKKVLLTAGGTGGHLFPALTLAKELQKDKVELLFAASGLRHNLYFQKSDFAYQEIPSATFSLREGIKVLPKLVTLIRGLKESVRLIKSYKPDLVVGFGSYHTLPVVLAALLLKVPYIINEQNVELGRVNRFFYSLSKSYLTHYPSKVVNRKEQVVRFPLRFQKSSRESSCSIRKKMGLDPDKKTVLVFGGSQGARTINQKVLNILSFFNSRSLQIIHLTGKNGDLFYMDKEYQEHFNAPYLLKTFESNMDEVYLASDFVIARAGASTIHELIEFEKPALLIPYPYAGHHQSANADFFIKQVQGGIKLLEKNLTDSLFCNAIETLSNEKAQNAFALNIKNWKEGHKLPSLAEPILREIRS